MKLVRQIGLLLVLVFICKASPAEAPPQTPTHLRTLITAREAHSLSSEEAARAYPIRLRAVVTYYDPYIDKRHGALFVHDSSGSIFVQVPARPILPLQAGAVVDIKGVSGPGDYAPVVSHARIKVVGQSHVPREALKATMQRLFSGSTDGQWVEVEGVVHSVHVADRDVNLDIATIQGPVTATTPRATGVDYSSLVDTLIRLHGNAGPVFNRKRQMVGVHLFFPSLHEVTVLESAPADPFAMPLHSIAKLLQFTPGLELSRSVRVQGTVTLQWPGRLLCIQQGHDGLCMQSAQTNRVSVGDLVNAVGFPAISQYKATLDNAAFRPVSLSPSALQATPVDVGQVFRGQHDSELVQIEGELIGQDHATGDLTLMLRSGRFLFPAILPREVVGSKASSWKEGSLLRLTGVCSIQIDPATTNRGEGEVRPGSVQILLSSLSDVVVLKAPSWWTPGNTLSVLSIVVLVAFASFAWIAVLRHRVAQQTQALRSSEERLRHMSQHDVLTGLPNRLLLNDRLDMAVKRAQRFSEPLGLLMVDLDKFKDVNDTLGHHAGDRVLCELAQRIRAAVRQTDTVARLGGDEFVVVLPDLHDPDEAESIAAHVVAAASAPIDIGDARILITVSVGVSTYPEGGADSESLLQSVDAAMYSVKSHGRNGFQVFYTGVA